jgi:hypothetical protein
MVELSTTSYQPTRTIWSWVVAEQSTCFRSGCDAPSTEVELDHRARWPQGSTSTANLWPGCKTDHKAKHAPGFTIEQTEDGSYALVTPAGFRHRIDTTEHPASEDFDETPRSFQFSATELLDAIAHLRERDAEERPYDLTRLWEDDPDEALAAALAQIDPAA